MFAGSCIGVICLVICLEFLRRIQREYNRSIKRQDGDVAAAATTIIARSASTPSEDEHTLNKGSNANVAATRSPTGQSSRMIRVQADRMTLLRRQMIRALLHTFQFGVAYILMLIAMSFNGTCANEKRTFEFH